MQLDDFRKRVLECGDAIITYKSTVSNKQKYNVCTLDFSTPYIKNKPNRSKKTEDTVLLFCWDTDSFRLLNPRNVISIVPLSYILKNDSP
jgi:hypothetical protein